jgi:hypothetical protein
MEKPTPNNLEDTVMLLGNAAVIRERRKAMPAHLQEPDENTEDDVIEAMQLEQFGNTEILFNKDGLTRALRIIIKSRH